MYVFREQRTENREQRTENREQRTLPKISVIVPVYNGSDYICECLDSIVNQTLKDIEIICVNDGSTDNSLSILKKYASKDTRIKIIDKKNEGQGYARKCGLDIASGKYIMFCDQDDKFASDDSFKIAFDRIEKYNTDIAIFKFAYWDEENIIETNKGYMPLTDIFKHSDEKYLMFSYFAPWLKIYRKSFLNKYDDWYFPKFAFIEDPPLHVQILLRAKNIIYINNILYFHRTTNPKSITIGKKYTSKHAEAFCNFTEIIKNILIKENVLEEYLKYFINFIVTQSFVYIEASDYNSNVIIILQTFFKNNFELIKLGINIFSFYEEEDIYPNLNNKYIFYCRAMLRFSPYKIIEYIYKRRNKDYELQKKYAPKISVIIPVYNVENYLAECLDSVINQTLKDIEIICVNDGSTDNSLSILKKYAQRDSRIKVIDKENEGLGYTRKAGLKRARGKYVLFLDSDDKYDSNYSLEYLWSEIRKYDSDILIFGISNYYDGNQHKWDLKIDKSENVGRILNFQEFSVYILNGCFSACNKLYRKKFLDSYNDWFFPKKIYYEDMPFHVQIMIRAKKICFTDKVTYLYRVNPLSITRHSTLIKDRRKTESLFKIIDIILNILIENKLFDNLREEFICFFISYTITLFWSISVNIGNFKMIIKKAKEIINKISISNLDIDKLYYSKEKNIFLSNYQIIFYKLMIRLSEERFLLYMIKKKYKISNEELKFKKLNMQSMQVNESPKIYKQINIQEHTIRLLRHCWSYRIGRVLLFPLSVSLEFYRFIRDYNLIKNSGLFDVEYYLAQNEDVRKAKIDPIKHYLKFGWKQGRNPSAKFNNNEYLDKRPDVKANAICPLVHFIKFGKNEK